jgi:hypothetical protein
MDTLPKTFHDTVLVARALDIRYLWIDSLCIIQDDKNDKKREFPKMGRIYQNAHLTILASDAENCSDGLFFDTSVGFRVWSEGKDESGRTFYPGLISVVRRVELPFTQYGNVQGSFFITDRPGYESNHHGKFPRFTPLFKRAWVTQEWTLSRRSILFLTKRIVWSCREYCEDECGPCVRLQRPKIDDWQSFIQEYSFKSLTLKGDRLPAIDGVATSLGKRRKDEYFAGLWNGDLPDNLLWKVRQDKGVSKELLYLPSWSWARHTGPIGFQLHGDPIFRLSSDSGLVSLVEISDVSHSGALRLRAYVGWVQAVEQYDSNDRRGHRAFLRSCFRGYSSCHQVAPIRGVGRHYIESKGLDIEQLSIIRGELGPIGWADWDLGSTPRRPIAWVAVKLERKSLHKGTTDALHVLYLRPPPLPRRENHFERVGMGVLPYSEASGIEPSCIEII